MNEQFSMNPEESKNLERETGEKTRKYLETLRPLGEVFSQYRAYGLRIDPKASSFAFDHQQKEIIVSPQLVEQLNLAPEEKKYVFLHELGHLIQFFQNPDRYLETFKIPEKKAQESGQESYRKAFSLFFNVFLDISANSFIRAQIPLYQRGERLENLPEDFYSKKAFPETDYRQLPLSMQFLNFLIRKTMVAHQDIQISEEVQKEIQTPISFFGAKFANLEEFVRTEIFNPEMTIDDLLFRLEEVLMPAFERLLEKDRKEGKLMQIPDELSAVPMDGDLSPETIEKIAQDVKEAKKSADKKYQDKIKEQLRKKWQEKGFSQGEIKIIEGIQERTVKAVNDLEDLWNNFIQKSVEIAREKVAGSIQGAEIAPEKLLSELPVLLTRPSEARIFSRYLPKEIAEAIQPKRIRLVLIADLSGSMDDEKRQAVQDVAYSLNKSLINFARSGQLAVAGEGREFPISIDYQIIGFGSSIRELTEGTVEEKKKREKKDTPQKDLDEELLRAILKIQRINLGGTEDNLALEEIKRSLTPQVIEELERGDEILVAIEITDGETASAEDSQRLVKQLNAQTGIYCRAIQIPGPVYSEKKPVPSEGPRTESPEERWRPEVLPPTGTFKEVWGEEWGKRLENLTILKETVVAILYDALRESLKR